MPLIKQSCAKCNSPIESVKEFSIQDKIILKLKCGHFIDKRNINCSSPEQIVSLDGKKFYPYQCDGVRFFEKSGGRALCADEMGLGKTVQGIGVLVLNPDMLPCLAIVKSALKAQWQKEFFRWGGEEFFAQIIDSPKDFVMPGLKAYIMSYDILRRFATKKEKVDKGIDIGEETEFLKGTITETEKSQQKGKLVELIEKMKIKTIILDECQQIKNIESQRTIFVRAICKHVPNVLALSGTPIKNNAVEYFPILNILHPEIFSKHSRFMMNDVDSYFTGYGWKHGGLRDPEGFKRKTESFIIRRERKNVLPDLPPIRRSFQFHELGKEVEKAYIEEFKKFRDEYNSDSDDQFVKDTNILAYMSKMRQIVGLSLINPCIDHVMEVMGSTDDRLTIFVHHNDVAERLTEKLNSLFKEINIPPCARHEAGSSSLETEESFAKTRVLVCSTLAGGEGLNLQKLCTRFVMLERQWNPGNEEQAESRFPRPEGLLADFIDGVYMTALGTINEFFAELVERKREIVSKTLGGKAAKWDQTSLMKELAEVLATNGGKRWSL